MYKDTKITKEDLNKLPKNDHTLALFDSYFKQTATVTLPEIRDTYFIEEETTNIIEPNVSFRTILDFDSYEEAQKYISKNICLGNDNIYIYNKDMKHLGNRKEVRNLVRNDESIELLLKSSIIVPMDHWTYTE